MKARPSLRLVPLALTTQTNLRLLIYILPCGFLPFCMSDSMSHCPFPAASIVSSYFLSLPRSPAYTSCLAVGHSLFINNPSNVSSHSAHVSHNTGLCVENALPTEPSPSAQDWNHQWRQG